VCVVVDVFIEKQIGSRSSRDLLNNSVGMGYTVCVCAAGKDTLRHRVINPEAKKLRESYLCTK